ncbi:NAD(P)H nitroreductase [Ferrimonas lipolytica]|uniref:Putative NAD(P)H nitroreductase n=1 Tax=Ferrimonas lipolytica TaxID=2724191 RepID=A0A6H1UD51_9GAMM|nr:NAD(P)H nitroreductase [Ferrimonas lipolytica]QIZ76136.1 NAD(P)H nitroreductase [Ferrimonas lipolytica]
MDAQQLLLNRHSQPRLTEPGPNPDQLQLILQAALRAPDHAMLKPYEFVVAQEEGLNRLGEIFFESAQASGDSGESLARARLLPTRAPMVITVIAKVTEHPKVPPIEQHLTAGCALLQMQQMALALGLGGVWRSGNFARDNVVRDAFGLQQQDEIVGFLYLGTPVKATQPTTAKAITPYWRLL